MSDKIMLTNVEKLQYQNIQLQRQLISMQETNVIKDVEGRTGVNISGWNMDLNTGECTPRKDAR